MPRSKLLAGAAVVLVVVLAATAWALGSQWGSVPPSPPPPVPANAGITVPIAPGAPSRLLRLDPPEPADPNGVGIGGADSAVTRDGRSLVSIDAEGDLVVTDLTSGTTVATRVGTPSPTVANTTTHPEFRHALALSPDGQLALVTDGWGHALRVVDLASRAVLATVPVPGVPVAVAATATSVDVGDATGALTTIDPATRRVLGVHPVSPGPVVDLVATPDRRRLVVVSDAPGAVVLDDPAASTDAPGRVTVVDGSDPTTRPLLGSVAVSRPHGADGTTAVTSPDGARAYVVTGPPLGLASPDGATAGGVAIVDLHIARVTATIPGPVASAVTLSPDGSRLYVLRNSEYDTAAGPEPQWMIDGWDVADPSAAGHLIGSLRNTLTGSSAGLLTAAPDGRRLYTVANGLEIVDLRP